MAYVKLRDLVPDYTDFKARLGPNYLRLEPILQKLQELEDREVGQVETGNGTYDVTDFGITGDGVTDNRVALQSLIDKVALEGGGNIYFPPGRYLVTQKPAGGTENQGCIRLYRANPSAANYRNITLSGAGPNSQIVMYATLFKAVALFVVGNGASNIRFNRLRFVQRLHTSPLDEQTHLIKLWGNPTLALATGLSAGPSHVAVEDCDFGMVEGDQIQIIGEEASPITDVLVSRSDFRGRLNEFWDVTGPGTRSAVAVQRAVSRARVVACHMDESDDQLIDFEPTSLGSDNYFVVQGNILNGRSGTTVLTGSGVGATTPNVGLVVVGNVILGGTVHAINMRQVIFMGNHVSVPSSESSNGPVAFTRTVDLCAIVGNTIDVVEDNGAFNVIAVQGDSFGTPNHTVIANNTLRWDSCANGIYLESCDFISVTGNTMLATNSTPTGPGVEGMDQKVGIALVPVQGGTGRGCAVTGNVLQATGLAMQSFFNDGGATGEVAVTGNVATGVTHGYRQQNAPLTGNFPVVTGNSFDCASPVSITTGGFAVISGNGSTGAGVCLIIGPDASTALPNSFTALNGIGLGSQFVVRGAGSHKKLWVKDAAGTNGWMAVY